MRASRRKSWFRVADSVYREAWPDHILATMIRLAAYLHERWARDGLTSGQACSAIISRHELGAITRRAQLVHSRRILSALGEHVTLSWRALGESTEIMWPKYAEFQNLGYNELAVKRQSSAIETAPLPLPLPRPHSPPISPPPGDGASREKKAQKRTRQKPDVTRNDEKKLLDAINTIGKRNYAWTETSEHRRHLQRILRQTPAIEEIEAVLRHRFEFWSATPEMLQYFRPATLAAHWDDYRAQASSGLKHQPKTNGGPDLSAGFQAWDRVVLPELRRGVLHRRVEIADQRVAQALRSIGGLRVLGESPAAMLPRKRSDFAAAFALIPAASQPVPVETIAHG